MLTLNGKIDMSARIFIILAGSRIKLWEIGHKPVPLRDSKSPVARLVREQGAIGEVAESG